MLSVCFWVLTQYRSSFGPTLVDISIDELVDSIFYAHVHTTFLSSFLQFRFSLFLLFLFRFQFSNDTYRTSNNKQCREFLPNWLPSNKLRHMGSRRRQGDHQQPVLPRYSGGACQLHPLWSHH